MALLAWRWACASLHWENRCSHNGRRKQIIRTRLLYPIGSKFGLSLFAYVCRKRCRRKALRKTRPEPSTAYLVWTRVRSWGRGRILSENERSGGVPAADNLACRYSETANTTTPYIKPYDTTVALCGEPPARRGPCRKSACPDRPCGRILPNTPRRRGKYAPKENCCRSTAIFPFQAGKG